LVVIKTDQEELDEEAEDEEGHQEHLRAVHLHVVLGEQIGDRHADHRHDRCDSDSVHLCGVRLLSDLITGEKRHF